MSIGREIKINERKERKKHVSEFLQFKFFCGNNKKRYGGMK
jgi:hypothetical protein